MCDQFKDYLSFTLLTGCVSRFSLTKLCPQQGLTGSILQIRPFTEGNGLAIKNEHPTLSVSQRLLWTLRIIPGSDQSGTSIYDVILCMVILL